MHIRFFGAALAAGLVVSIALASSAHADIVKLRDGNALPKGVTLTGGVPSDEQMEEHKAKKLEPLGYDAVKLGGIEVPVGMIDAVWTYDTWFNTDYQAGERSLAGGVYDDAADNFRRAAEALKTGGSKQLALYRRVVALGANNDADGMVAAIDDLLAESPKTLFLGDVQRRRARVLFAKGDKAAVTAALDKVIAAPGMNKHDVHETELFKIHLEQVIPAGKNVALWAAAEAAYRARLKAIEGDALARTELEDLRLRALVGIGRCLVFQNKTAEARVPLEQVVASPAAIKDRAMLAAAYNGLGDVVFTEARDTQAKAAGNEELKKKAAEQLENALLHYLRVTEFYFDEAEQGDLFSARLNAARVFAAQFGLSNDKDCEPGVKALNYYIGASKLLSPGLERTSLTKEYGAFKARVDKVPCK